MILIWTTSQILLLRVMRQTQGRMFSSSIVTTIVTDEYQFVSRKLPTRTGVRESFSEQNLNFDLLLRKAYLAMANLQKFFNFPYRVQYVHHLRVFITISGRSSQQKRYMIHCIGIAWVSNRKYLDNDVSSAPDVICMTTAGRRWVAA